MGATGAVLTGFAGHRIATRPHSINTTTQTRSSDLGSRRRGKPPGPACPYIWFTFHLVKVSWLQGR